MRSSQPALFALISAGILACTSTPPGGASPATTAAPSTATVTATPSATAAMTAKAEAPHAGTRIEFPSSGGNASGYLALPAAGGDAKKPALVVIQEWWGLNDWIKTNADEFAKRGYVALAIDLYRGKVAANADEAHELMRGLPEDRAAADLKAAVDALAARPDVDPARIGAVGWCMGGGHALGLATREPRLKAAVINYGRLVTDPAAIQGIHASIMGNFAGEDRGIAVTDVNAYEAAMKAEKKSVDIKVYPGAGHAFMNPNNAKGYDAKAADDAWARIYGFFSKELGGK